ncbi:MAG: S-layer homology domain-containing protein, partial [Candidatus Sericytochromatia bacterium]|nr:S-layer homology domain-containing protein [Candidatus Sericytochromatia bacterium]
MPNRHIALTLALATGLGLATPALAQGSEERPEGAQQRAGIRADLIKSYPDAQIADMPGGHWATHATQVAVANQVLALENEQFKGDRELTTAELAQGLQALAVLAEGIAARGMIPEVRAAVEAVPLGEAGVSRLSMAQATARLLDAINQHGLIALAEPATRTTRFTDVGLAPPPAIRAVVDTYKVMSGFRDRTFRPQGAVTRYEFAAVATHVLEGMRRTPLAQLPMEPPQVVVVPEEPAPPEQPAEPAPPEVRTNFREHAPIALSWQALNATNILNAGQGISVVPVSGMVTGHAGPVMVQGVGNFRYDLYATNLFDGELRVGYNGLKAGMVQLIPYIGANAGVGTAVPGTTEYSTYYGASYGGILSVLPWERVEVWGSLGQSALLGGGRFNQAFQPITALSAA